MARAHTDHGEFGLQIAPMLDILFVLLLFFMVAAATVKQEASIATQLPGKVLSPGPEVPVQITIDENGQVSINSATADAPSGSAMPETISRLRTMIADSPKRPVFVTPTAGTRQQRVVDVLNACTAAGVRNLALGANP
jgi:biopolymer transport protein ExbD